MFIDHIEKAFIGAVGAVKNLAFAVKNEFLEIKCHRFRDAEVLGVLRHIHLHFFTHAEKVIDGIAAGEDHGRVSGDINLLFAKVFCRNGFELDERFEFEVYVILPGQLKIG